MPKAQAENGLVTLTPSAGSVLKRWLDDDRRRGIGLRVSVEPGGCSGLRYQVQLDVVRGGDDLVCPCDGVDVLVHRSTEPYVRGATIDYSDTGFSIRNPNADGACLCGATFSVKTALSILAPNTD